MAAGEKRRDRFSDTLRTAEDARETDSEDGGDARRKPPDLSSLRLAVLPLPVCAPSANTPVPVGAFFLSKVIPNDEAEMTLDPAASTSEWRSGGCPVVASPGSFTLHRQDIAAAAGERPAPRNSGSGASLIDMPDRRVAASANGEEDVAVSLRLSAAAETAFSPAARPALPATAPVSVVAPTPATAAQPAAPQPAGRDEDSESTAPARQNPVAIGLVEQLAVPAVKETGATSLMTEYVPPRQSQAASGADKRAPQSDSPSADVLKVIERIEELGLLRRPSGPVREINWKAELGGPAKVQVRIARIGGEVLATIRTSDQTAVRTLRGPVAELVTALRRQGLDAEVQPTASLQPHEQGDHPAGEGRRRREPEPNKEAFPVAIDRSIAGWMEPWVQPGIPNSRITQEDQS